MSIFNFKPNIDLTLKNLLDHLLLMKKVTWTMNGLMLPTDVKRRKTKPVLSIRMQKLIEKTSNLILLFKNGIRQDGQRDYSGKGNNEKGNLVLNIEVKIKSQSFYGS